MAEKNLQLPTAHRWGVATLYIIVSLSALAVTDPGNLSQDESMARTLVRTLYPGLTIDLSTIDPKSSAVRGTISRPEAGDVQFVLSPVRVKNVDSPKWSVYRFTRREPGWDQDDLETYLEGGPAPKAATIKDAVLLVAEDGPEKTLRYVPDSDAIWNDISHVEVGDLIGDGSLQLLVESEALYAADDPREFIGPGMFRLLRVPDFAEIFSACSDKIIIGPSLERTFEIVPRAFRIVPPKTGAVNDIVQISRKRNEEARFVYDGNTYRHVVERPQARTEKEIQKREEGRRLAAVEKLLSIIVENEDGDPIAGARVTGTWSSSRGWSSTGNGVSPFRGTTNANGEFSQSTPSSITIGIRATGYYPISRYWGRGQVPQSPVTITMKRAPQAVPMFEWVRVAAWWKEWRDQFSFGVSIAPAPPTKLNVTEERDKSDLWFEITTDDALARPRSVTSDDDDPAQVRRNWSMSIYALHGWQIAPGPPAPSGEKNDPNMRYAPKSGYVSELHFDTTENLALFLHHSSSGRYGKAYDLEFSDRSYPGIGNFSFHVEGLVQEENSGTTSLYPMSYEERRELQMAAQGPRMQSPTTTQTTSSSAPPVSEPPHGVTAVKSAPPPQVSKEEPPKPTPTTSEPNVETPSVDPSETGSTPSSRVGYYIVAGVAIVLVLAMVVALRFKRR